MQVNVNFRYITEVIEQKALNNLEVLILVMACANRDILIDLNFVKQAEKFVEELK